MGAPGEPMNFTPTQIENRRKFSRGEGCAGDTPLLGTEGRPAVHKLHAMRRDPRQSLPDLGSSREPEEPRRHVRSHSVIGVFPKSPDVTRHWLPNGNCPSHRTKDGGSRRARRGNIPGLSDPKASTIHQHYYPEGGWGWIVLCCALFMDVLSSTLQLSAGFYVPEIRRRFKLDSRSIQPIVIACSSPAVSQLISPLVVAVSKRQSLRLLAVLGGIATALGTLFTSFSTQLHQLYLSSGLVGGFGECLVRDTAAAIFGQYFKRKRHQVEMIFLAGYGFGIATIPLVFSYCLRTIGWTRGFQILAGMQSVTCFIAVLYRPASLYHPQRRAILHIKSLQKRSKTKDKTSVLKEKKQIFDFSVLKSKTVQILIVGTSITSFGITVPFTLMIEEMERDSLDLRSICQLQVSLGLAVSTGAIIFGLISTKNNAQCLIAKQYLCQLAAVLLSGWFLAYPTLNGFHGYVLFVWVYGICHGGYLYSLKLCVFEKVRARNYSRTWSFMMWSQALPNFIGISVIYHLNTVLGFKRGYYIASASVFLGAMTLFLIDVHKNNLRKKKQLELEQNADPVIPKSDSSRRPSQDTVLGIVLPRGYGDLRKAQELTCISEEILVDNCLEDYIDDCITSCNKEEKFLMLSEFENNLFKTEETLEKEKACTNDYDVDSEGVRYCTVCYRSYDLKGSERVYSPRKMLRTISNIDVIEEVTSL